MGSPGFSPPQQFPLTQDKNFLSESEWVILKLLIRPLPSLWGADAEELHLATGQQITVERAQTLINIVEISSMEGLGTWIASIMANAGLSVADVRTLAASDIAKRIHDHTGYPICNDATVTALDHLQQQWQQANNK
ncbi:MAG: hypothetical protein HQM07_00255 [Zetaproteobacteria bacterium]|nr:hypothetical protein [Zetaproteobacteria bacterium]